MQQLEKQFHFLCVPGDVADIVILPVILVVLKSICKNFLTMRTLCFHREFTIGQEPLKAKKVSVCSNSNRWAFSFNCMEELHNIVQTLSSASALLGIDINVKSGRCCSAQSNPL